ncbi:glycoside hydrolase [Aegicerativicinus sediminis]|uniref:glycoside hydrolase family 30 beta sandwich domain-containing protein n=1 Tax=Aegicerativicinus sediminis TaxID=2893202 RepID=UPI001E3C3063|nr:glycoside hydrolase family 30 beta sandwich domain-containing protein [Aegicerativicinus sediminis]
MKTLKQIFILIVLILSFNCSSDDSGDDTVGGPTPTPNPTDPTVLQSDASIIKPSEVKQNISGFGAATVFRLENPLSASDMDKLFGTDNGEVGLSMLRIRVATDNYSRGIELGHAQMAKARGAKVMATPWSPPAEMKTNNNLVGGSLKTDSYEDYANYLNDFTSYMNTNGAPLDAIGIQNEGDYQVSYESCDWTAVQVKDFVRDYGQLITNTKVISPESFQFRHEHTDLMLNDPQAVNNVDIIGGHIYGTQLQNYPYPLALEKGKELWMTEHYTTSDRSANLWPDALLVGKEIHNCMVIGQYSAYIWWYGKRYYGFIGDGEEGTGNGVVTKRGYVMSNFSKFIRPGYKRIEAGENPQTDVFVSAYSGDGKTVIVAINESGQTKEQQFVITGTNSTNVTPYITSASKNLESQETVNIVSSIDAFLYNLPPNSITTFITN